MARAELQWALSKQRAKELTCNKKSAIHEEKKKLNLAPKFTNPSQL